MKIYLAGWDVFRPNASEWGDSLKKKCIELGMEGLWPADLEQKYNNIVDGSKFDVCHMFRQMVGKMDRADIIMANGNYFRGMEMDTGTAFEVGYMCAQKKPIYIYLDYPDSVVARAELMAECFVDADGKKVDSHGLEIEDFGLPLNLMVAIPAKIFIGNAWKCLEFISEDLQENS